MRIQPLTRNALSLTMIILASACLTLSGAGAADNILLRLPLDGEARVIAAETPDNTAGVYYPTSDADQDKDEYSDPSNYRVPGRRGRALRFHRELQSLAEIPNWTLSQPETKLCVSVWIKPATYHIGTLVSCKTDSDTDGFALFVWGNRIRFQCGDGERSHTVEANASLYNQGWRHLEARFDSGTVTLLLDGRVIGTEATNMQHITPGKRTLSLGSYPIPGRGRKSYAYEGALDEVIVSRLPVEAAVAAEGPSEPPPAALEVLAEPISGNDQHFGDDVFHTFHGHPVPLSFLFRGDPERCKNPAFVLYLPDSVRLREAFSSNHNGLDQTVSFRRTPVEPGLARLESYDYDLTHRLTKRYGRGEILTIALDADPAETREAQLAWALVNDGEEGPRRHAAVRFLELPEAPYTKGEFEIMAWSFADDMAFFDPGLFQQIADLYKSSGIWAKGRWYAGDHNPRPRRAALDLFLRDQGFTLYDVSLWHGPIGSAPTEDVPSATMRQGLKPDPKRLCPTAMTTSESFRGQYEETVRSRLCTPRDGDWVAIDFEPWGYPTKICYCECCLDRFRQSVELPDEVTNDQLRKKIWDYQHEWAVFWTQHSTEITRMIVDAVHKVDPRLRVVDYTYAFEYDSPELLRRFWSIPKDPRLIERVVDESMLSFYHLNDRRAFDMLEISLRHLRKPVSVIVSLSRANAQQGRYTTPEESLSPQRLKQKILLCTAQGVRKVNLFPGRYIDGRHHLAMGEASRLVWKHERFYFHGRRQDERVTLQTAEGAPLDPEEAAYTVWTAGDESLVTLLNFSAQPLALTVHAGEPVRGVKATDGLPLQVEDTRLPLAVTVPAHGTRLLTMQR